MHVSFVDQSNLSEAGLFLAKTMESLCVVILELGTKMGDHEG
jgi:hypothetical protein